MARRAQHLPKDKEEERSGGLLEVRPQPYRRYYLPKKLELMKGKMEIHHRFSILKERQYHNFHSDVIYCQEFMGNQSEIHEKRCASALPAAICAAIPLHSTIRVSSTTSQSASDTSIPRECRAAASSRKRQLPKHVEPDPVATMCTTAAPQRTSLAQGQQLDHRRQHSHAPLDGRALFFIHQ